jgi:2-C-methyl-D-erythritol 4-phosphate cytidylyltransferase
LAAVPAEAEVIVVHDAARPVSGPALFAAVLAALSDEDVAGAVPGLPPGDTIKVVDEEGWVVSTPLRRTLVAVQTPQAFRATVLREAHADPDPSATDDAMMVEAAGGRIRVVPGEPENLKITTPGDLDVAERVLAQRVPASSTGARGQ